MSSDNDTRLVPVDPRPDDPLLSPGAQAFEPRKTGSYAGGYGYANESSADKGIAAFREFVRIVRKNVWMILTVVTLSTAVVAVAAFKVDTTYKATVTIQIEDPQTFGLKDGTVSAYSFEKYYKTQLELLRMPKLVRRVVVELDLEHNPNFFSNRPKTLDQAIVSLVKPPPPVATKPSGPPGPPPDLSGRLDEETALRLAPYAGAVAGATSIQEVDKTQLIKLNVLHHNPELAIKIVNSMADNFVAENLNQRVNKKATASDFLQKRIAELQSQVRAGEERLLNYGRSHEILSINDGEKGSENPALKHLADLNAELFKAQSERQQLELVRANIKDSGPADVMRLPAAQQDPAAQEVTRSLAELRQRRSELLQKYTEEYPEVKSINERIVQREADLARIAARLAADSESQYRLAVEREKSLREEFEHQRGSMMEQNEAAISYKILKQEVETNKQFLTTLLGRQKEVDISAANEVNNVSIQDYAVAANATGPDRYRWIMLSFFVSLVGGLGLAFGREYLDQTIKSIEDIDRVAQLPALGIIPALGTGGDKRSRRKLSAKNGPEEGAPLSTELVTTTAVKSAAAEAYRQLRTSVLLSSAGHPSRVLLVTSSQPREGKTTTAVNTAISLAQTGAKVVIVDCDMRKPRVHQLLNATNEAGLSLLLSGQRPRFAEMIQEHTIPNLAVLPCGPIPPNPAELLGSDQMRKLIELLGNEYDHVVIDSPPVVSFADAVILSTMVDGVILVVRGGFTSKGIVRRSRQLLTEVGAKIYGVVLNDADLKSSDAYYYYSYDSEYYEVGKSREASSGGD